MSEKLMRQNLIRTLRVLDAVSVENSAYPGTPDINFTGGWMECKWLPVWPTGERTVVQMPHFTAQQRAWMRRRCRAGGVCWFMLQCRREWLLLPGHVAAVAVGGLTRKQIEELATKRWDNGLVADELLECLTDATAISRIFGLPETVSSSRGVVADGHCAGPEEYRSRDLPR